MSKKTPVSFLFISLFLTLTVTLSCSQNDSHLPSLFDLPSAVGSVIENAGYQSKRKKVASYVAKHYSDIRQDVSQGGGQALDGVLEVAGIKGSQRTKAREMMISSQKHTFYNAGLVADALINVFASLYVKDSRPRDKKVNGYNYFDARNVIQNKASSDFENLRISIKQGQGEALDQLMSTLRMKNAEAQRIFKNKAQALYKTIYLEPVIVAIMVNA